MLSNPFVQLCLSVSIFFALIVGYAVMLLVVLAAFIYPVAKFGKKVVFRLLRIKSPSEELAKLDLKNVNFLMPPVTMDTVVGASKQYAPENLGYPTLENMQGLSYLAGRPVVADSEKTDFIDMVGIMHHQI